jgi:Protein of unknown function DUF58
MSVPRVIRFNRWGNFFPFQITLFVLLLSCVGVYYFLKQQNTLGNEYLGIVLLLFKIALWSLCSVLLLSFVLSFCAYLLFRYWYKHKIASVNFQIDGEKKLNIQIKNICIPFLGSLNMKVFYEPDLQTKTFIVGALKNSNGWPKRTFEASLPVDLHHYKDYRISGGILYFEDILKVFSFPISFNSAISYMHFPEVNTLDLNDVIPQRAQEVKTRIPELKRVNGDWLAYKKFDQGDDTRRILWKVFAKNRELMVRQIETQLPFASEFNVYINFENVLNHLPYENYFEEMLNYYKSILLSVLETLSLQNVEINYFIDSTANISKNKNAQIIHSEWQEENNNLKLPREIHLSIFHSLSPVNKLEQILNVSKHKNAKIILVRLGAPFQNTAIGSLAKRIFLLPPENPLQQLKDLWWFSPIKNKTRQQELKINLEIKKSGKEIILF